MKEGSMFREYNIQFLNIYFVYNNLSDRKVLTTMKISYCFLMTLIIVMRCAFIMCENSDKDSEMPFYEFTANAIKYNVTMVVKHYSSQFTVNNNVFSIYKNCCDNISATMSGN